MGRPARLQDPDMILDILVRLPVKSIFRFRCVSKAWCKLFKDPYFIKRHVKNAIETNRFSVMMHPYCIFSTETYTLAYNPSSSALSDLVEISYPSGTMFWGTCNGLICLTTTCENTIVLWNPATKESRKLPTVPIRSEKRLSYVRHGFGYDDKMDDYKIVNLLGFRDVFRCEVHVYSLKSNSWRRLESLPYDFYYPGRLDIAQVSVNGAMHWLAQANSEPHKVIVSFDFKDEKFVVMPLPSTLCEYGYGKTNLCSLGGSLCFHASLIWGSGIDVWEMKEYGVTESWAKLFTIDQATSQSPIKKKTVFQSFSQLVPLQYFKDGKVLLGYEVDEVFHLDFYDLKRGTSKKLMSHDADDNLYADTSFVYVESLVPLNSGTDVGLSETEDSKDSGDDDDSEEEDEEEEDDSEEGDNKVDEEWEDEVEEISKAEFLQVQNQSMKQRRTGT